MKAVAMSKPFSVPTSQFGAGSYQSMLLPDTFYVWDDMAVKFFGCGTQDYGGIEVIDIPPSWSYPTDAQSIAIFAPGGIGDSLITTSVAKQIHEDSGSEVYVVTTPFHAQIYDCDFVAGWLCHPVRYDVLSTFDQVLSYDGVITDDRLMSRSYSEVLGDIAGIGALRYPIPQYGGPTKSDVLRMKSILPPRSDKKRVGIHMRGSMWPKTWPPVYSARLACVLAKRGVEVLLMGARGDFGGFFVRDESGDKRSVPPPIGVFNMCGHTETVGDIAAMVDSCDVVVCPDSAVLHLSAVMGVPAVLLSGPFPSSMRASSYPNVVGIDSDMACAPCHATLTCPDGHNGTCAAMAAITPEQVESKVVELL